MFTWAKNQAKLQRAIQAVGSSDENKLKEYYITIGGLVDNTSTTAQPLIHLETPKSVEIENTTETVYVNPLRCTKCDYVSRTKKGLAIHIGKNHK